MTTIKATKNKTQLATVEDARDRRRKVWADEENSKVGGCERQLALSCDASQEKKSGKTRLRRLIRWTNEERATTRARARARSTPLVVQRALAFALTIVGAFNDYKHAAVAIADKNQKNNRID